MKQKKIKIITLGTFEVTSDKLVISDPCYDLGTWCMGTVPNVKPGLWTATIGIADTGEFGERIAFLAVFHQDSPPIQKLKACPASFDVGVDSGQAGIFDYNHFHDEEVIEDQELTDFGSRWFTYCCYQTLDGEHHAGLIPYGVVASSGFGDGCYSCYVYTDWDSKAASWGVIIDFQLTEMRKIMRQLLSKQEKEGQTH